MKFFSALLALAFVISGCNTRTEELEKQAAALQSKNSELSQELSTRDAYIDSVTQSMNEVYDNIERVRSKERQILQESSQMETTKKLNRQEVREKLLQQISTIDSNLASNRKKINDLQAKVSSYRTQFAGLKNMVATLKQTIEEREQAIAQLEEKVRGLETQVSEGKRLISERDSVITRQTAVIDVQEKQITTGFYIVGTRKDLESKGIITREGGFLWGLLGSTTVLANGFNREYFKPINKEREMSIEVTGKIVEIVPKRNEQFYTASAQQDKHSLLNIVEPKNFWQDNYLVIITE
ncbi:MAG: hypothetical protein HYR76_07145 [Ignavibacteria bacterium]|nr:hypothetical protein [Ignavibacteria bacterium]MBI3765604.1 hypothetical protein [Ignavibacteriales bacterium]